MVEVYRPQKLSEALKFRAEQSVDILAGGTDLMVRNKTWAGLDPLFQKSVLVLDDLDELKTIDITAEGIQIGAACNMSQIIDSQLVPDILKKAILTIAAPATRNRATMTGNVCNASPAGDTIPPLMVLNASVVLETTEGGRIVPIAEFITAPGQTLLRKSELVTSIIIPIVDCPIAMFKKVGTRKANALTKLSVTGLAKTADNRLIDLRIAFGAVGPVIIRSKEIENRFKGAALDQLNVEEMVRLYDTLITPIDDQRSTAEYRKTVSLNILRQFLEQEIRK